MGKLENYGVHSLNSNETKQIDGGVWPQIRLIVTTIVAIGAALEGIHHAGEEFGKDLVKSIRS